MEVGTGTDGQFQGFQGLQGHRVDMHVCKEAATTDEEVLSHHGFHDS